jgi:NAD(P)-dependent dehydrogenase (short-subunit alcohol dehydrogenase family)
MKGKVVVITGGTSGIGEVAAETLAQMGARIILVARNKSRAEATIVRLRRSGPGVAHSVYFADLSRLAEMKRLAAEIADREPPIDILINNAGALFGTRRLTEDGLEYTFALNHMAYFVVTHGLRERLLASGGARIINTASAAHQGATLDFDDLQSAKNFRAMRAYGRSKLCNILFTRQLARSLQGTNVTANCLHPGFVATRFADESGGLVSRFAWLAKLFAISPSEGAQTIAYLASSPEVANVTGQYFYKCRPTTPSAPALDDRAALTLWERSAALAGIKGIRARVIEDTNGGR